MSTEFAQHHLSTIARTATVCGREYNRAFPDEYNPVDETLDKFKRSDVHCSGCHEQVEKGRTLR